MRKRYKRVEVHLTEEEYRHLKWQVSNSELKTEPFIRALIMGTTIEQRLPNEYRDLLRELSAIGNNVNQLAKAANAKGYANQEDIRKMLENQKELWLKVKNL